MKNLFTLFLAIAVVQAKPAPVNQPRELTARGVDIKVQYYTDGGCKDYAVSFHPSTSNSCYGYSYSNTNSANIVSCSGRGVVCSCYFYEQDNCKGKSARAVALEGTDGSTCQSNWGKGYRSMQCYTNQF
ncbi:uncharacterized protein QYS62_010801 [Fusarium acuminatum]|uniref:Small secreted protein n=1 Tax=Fusarium acuminatum TaxID=5515 RepID=A0ABZ2XCK3_9HYPO